GGEDAAVPRPPRPAGGCGGLRLRRGRQQRGHPRVRPAPRSRRRRLGGAVMSSDSSPLSPADGAVLLAYLLGTTALGLGGGRRSGRVAEYFMPRKSSKRVMVMYAFGTWTASDQAVVVASATFQNGLSGIWYQWLWLFATPFYWMIAPIMRRFRAITTA